METTADTAVALAPLDERFVAEADAEAHEYERADFDELYPQISAWHWQKKTFLLHLRMGASARKAGAAAHVARITFRRWINEDPLFEAAYNIARTEAAEMLVEEARRRAVDGTERVRPIFFQGVQVGEERWREFDGKLLTLLIQSESGHGLEDKYKTARRLEVSGKIDHFMQLAEGATDDQAQFDKRLAERAESLASPAEEVIDAEVQPV